MKHPKFGDVFEYKGGGRIMYVAPVGGQNFPGDWVGVTVRQAGNSLQTLGEVAQRVPLEGDRFSHWEQVDDAI